MSTPSPLAVRHSKVTYGRRHKDPDDDLLLADTSAVSNNSSADEPPSSDGADVSSFMDGLVNGEECSTHSPDFQEEFPTDLESDEPKFEFSWKKQLAAMDDSDEDEGPMVTVGTSRLLDKEASKSLSAAHEHVLDSPHNQSSPLRTSRLSEKSSAGTLLVDSSLTDLLGSPKRTSRSKPRITIPSEVEDSEPSSPQTPSHSLHHLNTPPRHSSPTPPTSTETAARKGKASVATISPPRFNEADNHSDEERPGKRRGRNRKLQQAPGKRIKPPTRKEREETEKTTARMRAAQQAEVPRGQTKRLRLNELFANVHRVPNNRNQLPSQNHLIPPSDPIEQWSSSSPMHVPAQVFARPLGASRPLVKTERELIPTMLEDSDDDMPDIVELIKQREEEDEERKRTIRNTELAAERKRRAMEQMQLHQPDNTSDDDDGGIIVSRDMHSVAREEDELRRRQKLISSRISTTHPQLVTPRVSKSKSARAGAADEVSLLAGASANTFGTSAKQTRHRGEQPKLRPADLNEILLKNSGKVAQEITTEKETNWLNMGGKVLRQEDGGQAAGFSEQLISVLQRGLQNNDEEDMQDEGQSSSGSDGDWRPEVDEDTHGGADVATNLAIGEESTCDDKLRRANDSDEPDNEVMVLRKHPRARVVTTVVDSDDEENSLRGSSEEKAESETDKENNAALMFDQGEDKENTAIHPSASLLRQSMIGRMSSLSSDIISADGVQTDSEDRNPFRDISKDDDPFLTPTVRMPPSAGLSDDFENTLCLEPAPLLRAGLSQLFGSGTAEDGLSSKAARSFSQFVTPAKDARGLGDFRKDDAGFALTFEPSLQPALNVTDSVRKKADNIFEKEQEFMVGDENSTYAGPQMFVNENGFLTQTRPSNADVARLMSSTHSASTGNSPFSLDSVHSRASGSRRPLGDIDLDDLQRDDDDVRFEAPPGGGRLKRRRISPDGGYRSSVSPSLSPVKRRPVEKNAFLIMREAQTKPLKKLKLKRSDFVDGQAEESDEDDHFGFGGQSSKKFEEEEEEDNEEELENLNRVMVDDAVMDESTLNEDMVLEKHRERVEEDDAIAYKVAQDAISGKLRARQGRHGIVFEDDDDSDEDDDNVARRHKMMRQKRKLGDYDSLHALSKDEKSAAFLHTYEASLEDDDQDFKHLNQAVAGYVEIPKNEYVDESDEEHEEVSPATLANEVRAFAQGRAGVDTRDPNDTSWVDQDNDDMAVEESILIHEISRTRVRRDRPSGASDWDFEAGQLRLGDNLPRHGDGLARGDGMGRSVVASAVTGHARTKRGDGSIIGQRGVRISGAVRQGAKPIARAPSKLSAVSGRRAHFAD